MKKLFFFRSSADNNPSSLTAVKDDQTTDRARNSFESPRRGSSRNRKQVLENSTSGTSPPLRRSLSFSSAALDEGGAVGQKYSSFFTNQNESPCSSSNIPPRQGADCHPYRRALTPERRSRSKCLERDAIQNAHMVDKRSSSSESSSYCSSNVSNKVVDRYIDGEQDHESHASKNNPSQRNQYRNGHGNGKRPPQVQLTAAPALPRESTKDKSRAHSLRETKGTQLYFPSRDWMENEFGGHASPRSLAKHVIERLSQSHVFPKASSKEFDPAMPITIEDIYGGSLSRCPSYNADKTCREITDFQKRNSLSRDYREVANPMEPEEEIEVELLRKSKEAEERFLLLSEEIEREDFLEDRRFTVPELIQMVRNMKEERVSMAYEVLAVLNAQIAERASTNEEERFLRAELDSRTRRLEKEKNELQSTLEKELDRRSSDWSFKLEKYRIEEHRLRERVRELAEQNVSLQRDVSSLSEREMESRSKISGSDSKLKELSSRMEEISEENGNLQEKLSKLEENYRAAEEDLDCIKRNCGEEEKECKDLHRSITRLLRTCGEQEKTIDGLRKGLHQEIGKKGSLENFDSQTGKLQMEQIRLTGVEQDLRKEVESFRFEVDSLRRENVSLLHRLKVCGKGGDFSNFKLDQELLSCVSCMQNQGILLVNESNQLCTKLLEHIKVKAGPNPETKQSDEFMMTGLDGQFIVESEVKLQGLRRGTTSLTRSLQTISSALNEKSNHVVMDSRSHCSGDKSEQRIDQNSKEDLLKSELKAETLLTSLLREKLYTKEVQVEQLQAELAAAVRGNGMLRCEVQNAMDNISCMSHRMKDLELQIIKKDDKVNQLQNGLQECTTELTITRGILPKVSEERDLMWEEVKQYSERNMLLNSEISGLKKKIEALEEDILLKEGQISILKDTIGKPFDLLASPDCM